MTFYDIFTYLCTFTIIIPLAVFFLFPVINHLKTPIHHLLIKISLVFICYFVLLIIPYDLSTGSGQYSYIPCCTCVLLSISKRNEPDASCISLCYADCMLSWFSFLCYLSYIRCHLSSTWTKYRILSRIHDRTTDLSGFRRYHLI